MLRPRRQAVVNMQLQQIDSQDSRTISWDIRTLAFPPALSWILITIVSQQCPHPGLRLLTVLGQLTQDKVRRLNGYDTISVIA